MEISSLDVVGHQNQHVPNTFIIQANPDAHLGIILPGYRHSADRADLHYPGRMLLDRGADLLRVDYAYYQTDFMQQPDQERDSWLSTDVFAACNAALAYRSYQKITLVGKSLGTIAMGHLLGDDRFHRASCVWSTPLLAVPWLRARIEETRPRSLFIIGTVDKFYDQNTLRHLEGVTGGRSVVIEGADHGLEVSGSIPQSLAALTQIVEAVHAFLDESATSGA